MHKYRVYKDPFPHPAGGGRRSSPPDLCELGHGHRPAHSSEDIYSSSGIAVDARLFHEAGCRLVHKYRVYKDPFPHPAGGGGASFLAS